MSNIFRLVEIVETLQYLAKRNFENVSLLRTEIENTDLKGGKLNGTKLSAPFVCQCRFH